MNEFQKNERCLNKKVQKKYYDSHPYDEYLKSVGYGEIPRHETHEILFGSEKTYTEWNCISLTRETHSKAHKGIITKEQLFIAKIKNGLDISEFPDDIIKRFDLDKIADV